METFISLPPPFPIIKSIIKNFPSWYDSLINVDFHAKWQRSLFQNDLSSSFHFAMHACWKPRAGWMTRGTFQNSQGRTAFRRGNSKGRRILVRPIQTWWQTAGGSGPTIDGPANRVSDLCGFDPWTIMVNHPYVSCIIFGSLNSNDDVYQFIVTHIFVLEYLPAIRVT